MKFSLLVDGFVLGRNIISFFILLGRKEKYMSRNIGG